jgi:multisubunit Na+/H+ antiporter MnhF subunit
MTRTSYRPNVDIVNTRAYCRDMDMLTLTTFVSGREETMPLARTRSLFVRLWHTDTPLAATALLMAAALPLTLVGVVLDQRLVAGAAVWLKPAKFAASIAVYCLTLAWVFTHLPDWPTMRRRVGRVSAAVFLIEFGIIAFQAARGVGSHFNVATPLDGVLFSIMGTAIVLQTISSVAVLVALWKQRFADQALAWSLRLGLLITIVAAFSGGLMTRPTTDQLEQARLTGRMTVAGGHTVGAEDGGPALPGVGWSTTHGDLRVAHFVGLHALQLLPLLTVCIRRFTRGPHAATRLTVLAGVSYAGLFLLVLGQALRGQSIVAPDALTFTLLVGWLGTTASAAWLLVRPHSWVALASRSRT